jgi:hypothetical protein
MFLSKLQALFGGGRGTAARRPASSPSLEARSIDVRPHSYKAIAIKPPSSACEHARALAGKRFLVAEAPKLPLPSCDQRCTCIYQSFSDRRDESRRASDIGITSSWYMGPERRGGQDRRGKGRPDGKPSYYDYRRRS